MQHILLAVFPRQTGQETEAIIFTIAKVIQLYNTAKQNHKKKKADSQEPTSFFVQRSAVSG